MCLSIAGQGMDRQVPCTRLTPLMFAMLPSENASMTPMLRCMVARAVFFGLKLDSKLHQIHTDGGKSVIAAWEAVLPGVERMRDVRHVLVNIQKSGLGCKEDRAWAAGQVHFASTCLAWNAPLVTLFLNAEWSADS